MEEQHTSVMLRKLPEGVPADCFTLDWLFGHLPERSLGVMLLFLSLYSNNNGRLNNMGFYLIEM